MHLLADALVLAVLPHGEHGAVLRALTAEAGLIAGYVRGGRSRRLRPVLQPGNRVRLELRSRVDSQLAAATVELVASRAGLAVEPVAGAALAWLAPALAAVLPEGDALPRLYAALDTLLDRMGREPPAAWLRDVPRFELLLLAELGFGLDLGSCAATGDTAELIYVSPKSAQAVSAAAGAPFAARLLPLPAFLADPAAAAPAQALADALRLAGFFLARDLFTGRAAALLAARDRLVALAARAG